MSVFQKSAHIVYFDARYQHELNICYYYWAVFYFRITGKICLGFYKLPMKSFFLDEKIYYTIQSSIGKE